MNYSRYDICLAEVFFEDVEGSKIRPILILDDKTCMVLCLQITTNTSRPEDYIIKDWKGSGLREPSSIRYLKEIELDKGLVLKKIGHLQPVDIVEMQQKL